MRSKFLTLACCLVAAAAIAQPSAPSPSCPQSTSDLYARLRTVSLDSHRVYLVRDASIDRANLHIDLDDGTLAFTEDICGRITGAFFEGEGEVRLRPPNRVERGSMELFTGMAILEEQFSSVYLRFNDDTAAALQPSLRPQSDAEAADFVKRWENVSNKLTEFDALRLFIDFSYFLPSTIAAPPAQKFPSYLHAHLFGRNLGAFEVFWDAAVPEPLWAGQAKTKDDATYFDIWTSFAPVVAGNASYQSPSIDISITRFQIHTWVQPPTHLRASTDVDLRLTNGGERTLLFELSRFLKVEAVEADGHPVEFIQNPALEGTQLRRKGNDVLALIFPAPLPPAHNLRLHFTYAGDVLSEAGNGLLYVGERGTWYPNLGMNPAQFDMEFHYPANWTLVATGKQISQKDDGANGDQSVISHWISDRPIPVAGFNLGKYIRADARAGNMLVEAYGTKSVERSFPKPPSKTVESFTAPGIGSRSIDSITIIPGPPSPAHDAQAVADRTAKAVESFSQWFGPYPYSSLALTQMPGDLSQGWPGLVFLSTIAFLNPQEQADLHLDPLSSERSNLVLIHETAHQWWGDLVIWKSYRDQWIVEGLANYSALLILEQKNPEEFHQILDSYRRDLLAKNSDGEWLRTDGPVTFGTRLDCSHFPTGYQEISYERGTWMFHMLRSMFRDATLREASRDRDAKTESRSRKGHPAAPLNPDEPFFHALRKITESYAGKTLSTEQLIQVFEEELPRPLWYEHRQKLDWFLEGWIDGTSIPELATRDIRITPKVGATTITGFILQKDAPDDLVTPVPVYAATTGNTIVFLGEVLADGNETSFRLTAPAGTRKILLDPKQTLLTALK